MRCVDKAPMSRLGEIEIRGLRKRQQVHERASPEAIVIVREDDPRGREGGKSSSNLWSNSNLQPLPMPRVRPLESLRDIVERPQVDVPAIVAALENLLNDRRVPGPVDRAEPHFLGPRAMPWRVRIVDRLLTRPRTFRSWVLMAVLVRRRVSIPIAANVPRPALTPERP